MVTDRVPPVPDSLGESAVAVEPDGSAVVSPETSSGLAGDSASAAADTGAVPEAIAPVNVAPISEPETIAPVEPVAEVEVAAVTPTDLVVDEPSVSITDDLALAVGGARVYGLENEGSRVIVRASKQAWLRIESGDGSVLLNQTLTEGEMYRAPLDAGAILVARDAGAFELFIDGQALGSAGPAGLVLTGKSLNPDDLLRR